MKRYIQLTDEILEKNGFCDHPEKYVNDGVLHHFYLGDKYFIKNEDLHIGKKNDSSYYNLRYGYNQIYGIKSVYELQWLFDFFHIGIQLKTNIVYGTQEPQEEEEEE